MVEVPVSFAGDGLDGHGLSQDISAGGCRIQSTAKVEPGRYLRVSLSPAEAPMMQIDLAAVRWVQGQQFGLEFLYMHPEEYERLLQFAPASS